MKRYEFKVPGGKLVCAKVETLDNRIVFLQVTGDFFLLPETDLEDLEKQLHGVEADPEAIKNKVVCFFVERKTVIAGASPMDFAYVINKAIAS